MSVKIISDSTCDLSKELVEKYNIEIIPLHIVLGDEEYKDGEDISPDDIYEWADANKTTPKTSAIAITDVIDAYEKWLKEEENKRIIKIYTRYRILETIDKSSLKIRKIYKTNNYNYTICNCYTA